MRRQNSINQRLKVPDVFHELDIVGNPESTRTINARLQILELPRGRQRLHKQLEGRRAGVVGLEVSVYLLEGRGKDIRGGLVKFVLVNNRLRDRCAASSSGTTRAPRWQTRTSVQQQPHQIRGYWW